MSKDDFLDRHRHEIIGLILDAATSGRTGADLSLWLRRVGGRVDDKLAQIWQELRPEQPKAMEPPKPNGPQKAPQQPTPRPQTGVQQK